MKPAIALSFFIAVLSAGSAPGNDEIIVFSGQPAVQYQVDDSRSQRTKMRPEDSKRNALVIVRIGEDYFWQTRDNRRVIHIISDSEEADTFIDPDGGGYVKIMPVGDGTYAYLEHVGMDMTTFTYFGSGRLFEP